MEPKSSLPCPQEPSIGPYPEPNQSSPYYPSLSLLRLFSHLRLGLPSGLIPSGFPTKALLEFRFFPMCATCPVHLILDMIFLLYLAKSTYYEAPHYTISKEFNTFSTTKNR
jgi:hypothetical protein